MQTGRVGEHFVKTFLVTVPQEFVLLATGYLYYLVILETTSEMLSNWITVE